MMFRRLAALAALLFLLFPVNFGCQSTYYAVWERLGKEKRHLLKENVEEARTEQAEASEEFKDVLTRVKEIYGFQGGDLEDYYDRLKDDYDTCKSRAQRVEKRIEQVETIASDLFEEWDREIIQISKKSFRAESKRALEDAKRRYARLDKAMKRARSRMDTVLVHLHDYVLYLKHNLNARAVGALRKEVSSIETEVGSLIKDISKSIKEADEFLKTLS